MSIIANTTIVSNFARVGQIDLLIQAWPKIYIPEQVFTEIQNGLRQGYVHYHGFEAFLYPLQEDGQIHLTTLQTTEELRLYGKLLGKLHQGEAACLAIAHHRKWTFLSDDKAARQAGQRLKIPVSGTIGALILLVKQDKVTLEEADHLLVKMIAYGYFSPVDTLKTLL